MANKEKEIAGHFFKVNIPVGSAAIIIAYALNHEADIGIAHASGIGRKRTAQNIGWNRDCCRVACARRRRQGKGQPAHGRAAAMTTGRDFRQYGRRQSDGKAENSPKRHHAFGGFEKSYSLF